ncbi:transposase mutator type [Megasphaera sp. BL7]|nr:transposase mutator type [Megasphaera sp. BL7]
MYARGMSQRDIAATIEDIYGFQMSHEQISTITGCVMEEVEAWRNRPLQSFYPFAFVRLHLRIAAHGVWRPAGGRLCHACL